MKPVATHETCATYVGEGCADLPVMRGDGYLISFWQPSVEELTALNEGALVLLYVQGVEQPPVAIQTQEINKQ